MVSSVPAVMPVGSNWVGNLTFGETVKSELGSRAIYRAVEHSERDYTLREQGEAYSAAHVC